MKVKDVMQDDIVYLLPEASIEDCAKLMENNHIGCLPICDNNKKILGIVTDRDIILRSIACDKNVKSTPVKDIMSTKVFFCKEEDDITNAQNLMSKEQIRRLPVVDKNNSVIGMLSIGDLCMNKNTNEQNVLNTLENICSCDKKNYC